ncbi:hypothetical protein IGI04_026480 [Brassica rapa subsp. trilocularis]|uniref:Uncharacterized protein n=1 Tax=Brassica rapa subsp. trilocularis TaxID=1813537 RepID=A0ABQ7KW74_BRACM|nr:hypothetical protein IGI04_026480 [Brassica rapa subsp. trilocularis]
MKVFQIWIWICMFLDLEDFWARRLAYDFQKIWIFGRLMGSFLRIFLKYNALEVFHTTSRKSSGGLLGNLPDDFKEVFQTTKKSFDGVLFHSKWSLSLHTRKSSRKSQNFDAIRSNAKLTHALTRRLPCKSSTTKRLTQKKCGRTDLKKKTNFIVSTSEITCLAHKSLLHAPRISNKSDPPRIVSFNGSMNHKKFRIKILCFLG